MKWFLLIALAAVFCYIGYAFREESGWLLLITSGATLAALLARIEKVDKIFFLRLVAGIVLAGALVLGQYLSQHPLAF